MIQFFRELFLFAKDFLKLIVVFIAVIFLLETCCEMFSSNSSSVQYNKSHIRYWKECIDGKEYIVSYRHLSINLDTDGKPIRCEVQDD